MLVTLLFLLIFFFLLFFFINILYECLSYMQCMSNDYVWTWNPFFWYYRIFRLWMIEKKRENDWSHDNWVLEQWTILFSSFLFCFPFAFLDSDFEGFSKNLMMCLLCLKQDRNRLRNDLSFGINLFPLSGLPLIGFK